ncbi:diguanylate cyclase [Clostridium sp. AM58-1XD]|uniref:diguanylate cyclase domain-containing protein n=1 Tax=Clostridium sp. AM58-1XD TaxID=2292307 RepID=UPI0015F4FF2C|nr:diguanylate cyclase [Clostridium sp. AM58-1XD]
MGKRDTILIVDDQEINRAILCGIFEQDYNLLEAENGEQALILLEQYHEVITVVLLDLIMPVKDGYQVLEELRKNGILAEVPVIVITADSSAENEVRAFDLGAADLIMKPFEPYVVKKRVENVIDLNLRKLNQQELIERQAYKLMESNSVMIDALSSVIEYRSMETGRHIHRIRMFTRVLLEDVARCCPEFGLDERKIALISSASSMHDIGKIAIPDSILNKPGKLTEEEFDIMKTHTVKGCEMLENLDRLSDRDYLKYAYNICRYHHERWNGKGYPDGLKGNRIPVCAQVVGIADCYDALTTDRVYRKAIAPKQASNMILNGECGDFSPKLLECFKNVEESFSRLSEEYADSEQQEPEKSCEKDPVLFMQDDGMDTLHMSQMKYFTLLHYMNDTVVEADLISGQYHVIYTANTDFEALKSGKNFKDALHNLAEQSIHPDDRETVRRLADEYIQEFLDDGLMKQSWKFRICRRSSGRYYWCTAVLLRVDMENPYQRRIMMIWEEQGAEIRKERAEIPEAEWPEEWEFVNLLGGVHTCLNDSGFTILGMNEGFHSMVGYTRDEIEAIFHNQYIEMIYPDDRRTVVQQVREQLRTGNSMEMEYRLTTKDGKVIWVFDKSRRMDNGDGKEKIFCVVVDITQSKQAQEELRLTLERHRIIMEQSNDIIFEWDMEADYVTYSSNWERKFGYVPISAEASIRIPRISHVHPEDAPEMEQLIRDMRSNVPYAEIEFRLADSRGRYIWSKIRAAAQFDGDGKPFKVVGVLMDIDEEKRLSQALKHEAERDGLTQVYNKNAGQRIVQRYLSQRPEDERAALIILDVDNFKYVNDNYGHMFGDKALQEIASELRRLFRSGDIISRIGGDEFMILMRGIPDLKSAETRIGKVIGAIHGLLREEMEGISLSCSAGIAICPEDGCDFEALFERGDYALYEAKAGGKNGFAHYQGGGCADRRAGTAGIAANTRIESSDAPSVTLNTFLEQVYMELYEAEHVEEAIEEVLEKIGGLFGVGRVYIFENDEDGLHGSNTFEWCWEGIPSRTENLRNFSYEEIGGRDEYRKLFGTDGIFYCSDIRSLPVRTRRFMESQNIKSILQCAIWEKGKFAGFIGFDDCTVSRRWTREQISVLSMVAKVIGTFLFKKRTEDRLTDVTRELISVQTMKQKQEL